MNSQRAIIGLILGFIAAVFMFIGPVASAESGGLRVGVARVKITPPVGIAMAGYYSKRASEGTHDDLYAKAIVLQCGDTKVAMVALDLIGTLKPFVEQARALIQQQTGILAGNVMISATHAHTGPVLEARTVRSQLLGGTDQLVTEYVAHLPSRIAECVRTANDRLTPATTAAAVAHEEHLAFNRRFHMQDGTVGWNPGRLNPDIIRPAGPVDPDVSFVLFADTNKKPLGAYVNFAMHLDTVGGVLFSADYPFTLDRSLANAIDADLITLFTIGCAGDINHIDVAWQNRQKGNNEAARIGTRLASAVLRSMETTMQPVAAEDIQVARKIVALPLARATDDDIAAAHAVVKRLVEGTNPRPTFREQVQAFKILDVVAQKGKPWEVEVQAITLGDQLAWVSLPGEVFVQLGMTIKRGSPFRQTIVVELANGTNGYIPDHLAYGQGNYEVISARCADGSGELLVDTAVAMLHEMFLTAKKQTPKPNR